MKPTPGPYFVANGEMKKASGPVVSGDDGTMAIAMFLDFGIGPEQARANAEAWIAGVAAVDKLERIREIIDREPLGENLRKLREEIKSALA